MRRRLPSYIPLMALVTACYLTVEVPFSVRLVEVLGGSPSQSDIDRMESFGRVLTGVAVSIWIVGVLVFPRMAAKGRGLAASIAVASIVGLASTWATYATLDQIAAATGASSTGVERKAAFLSVMARNQIATNGGFGDLVASGSNDWKAFVAVSPAIASGEALAKAAGAAGADLASKEALRLVGDQEAYRAAVFGDRFDSIRSAYQRYADGSKKYLSAVSGLDRESAEAWDRFQAELRKKYPDGLPGRGFTHASIVRHIKFDLGIPVDQNWSIRDRAGFIGPYKQAAAEKIEKAYRDGIESGLGDGQRIQPGLDIDGFSSHPAVQKRIREALGLPGATAAITPNMDSATFRAQVYAPRLADTQREVQAAVSADPSEFENGRFAQRGVNAVKAARLPAMAILLSIAGAALHIFKLSGYVAALASSAMGIGYLGGPLRHAVAIGVAIATFVGMAASGNPVTQAAAYGQMKGNGVYSSLLHGAISIQPRFSALGEAIGSVGGWQAFASGMPSPEPFATVKPTPLPTPAPR